MSAMKAAGAVGGLGSATAAIAIADWPGAAMVVAAIALPLAGMLWVLNSMARSHRLMLLITAVRGGTEAAATTLELPMPPKTLVPEPTERKPDPIV
jgi:hypothetical protein